MSSLCALALLISSCIHSSQLEGKLPQAPPRYGASEEADQAAAVGRFWRLFGDPQLDALVERALADNLTVAQSWARLEQAQANLTLARAGWWPTVSVRGEAGRSHTAAKFGELSATFDRITLSAAGSVAYEIDLWGKVRYGAQAAGRELEASADDVRAAYLSVAAQLVEAYFIAVELRATLILLEQTVASRQRQQELVARRYQAGVVTALDLYQAQQNLAGARAQRHQVLAQLANAEHALAILAGQPPGRGRALAGTSSELPAQVAQLPAGLPAQLLLRRPDLRAAQSRLMAADARVGQAVAGHYPSLTIGGSVGYQFDPAGFVWSILGGLLLPLFEGQRVAATVDLNEAQLQLALLSYRAALLQALREVEDALASGAQLVERVRWLEQKVSAAEGALRMSTDQYTTGIVTFLQVLTAEEAVFNARRELLSARRELIAARVQLARALGGGWMAEAMDEQREKRGADAR